MSRVLVRVPLCLWLCSAFALAACGDDGGGTSKDAPDTVLGETPSAISNQRLAHFTFSATGTVTDFSCKLDDGGASRCTSPFDFEVGDGAHVLTVTARNESVADATPAVFSWMVDATPPDTTITVGPPSLDNSTTAIIEFTGSPTEDVDHFECALDTATFTPCSSPQMYVALVPGPHDVRVRAVDKAGNPDATPARRTWVLDTSTPDTVITAGPADGSTSGSNVAFSFMSPDAMAVFECRFDNGAFTACSSPTAYNSLMTGSHVLVVRAKNPMTGAVDPTPAMRTWTVDGAAPIVQITSGPANPSNVSIPVFVFASPSADIAGFECQIDNVVAFTACTSPYTGPAVTDGMHTFRVRVTDSVGNTSTDTYDWIVDTQAPTVTITGGPSGSVNTTSGTFTFNTAGSPSSVRCKLDSAAYATCASPTTVTGFTDGPHTFTVQVADAAGNTAIASRSFTVVTQGPTVVITGGPTGPTPTSTPTFTFTTTNASTIDCRLDGGTYAACTSPFTTPALSEGLHSFEVRVRDVALNQANASQSFTVDTTSPTVAIQSGPSGPTNQVRPTFTFVTGGSPMLTQCRFDAGAFAGCSSPFTPVTALAPGGHTFEVRVTDAAGNMGMDSRTFSVVTTGPTVTITSGPSGPTNVNTPIFTFTTTGAPSTIACQVDAAAFAACTSPFSSSALPDGSHTFTVRVSDTAGNQNTDTRSFTVDTELPLVAITTGPSGPTNDSTPTFGFTSTGTSTQCRFDTAAFGACTSPITGSLADGPHLLEVRATDDAGNSATAQRSFSIDTVNPTVAIGPESGTSADITNPTTGSTTTDPTPTFTFTATGQTRLECKLDLGSLTPCTSPFTTTELGGGSHTFTVRATDAATNFAEDSRTFTVNSDAPTATLTGPTNTCPADPGVGCAASALNANPTRNNRPSFRIDLAGDFLTVRCRYDAVAYVDCKPATGTTTTFAYPTAASSLTEGTHQFQVQSCNPSGICSTASKQFVVDTVAPTIAIASGPTGGCAAGLGGPATCFATNDQTPDFTFATTGAATRNRCRINTRPSSGGPVFGTFIDCALTTQTIATLAEGRYTLETVAYDDAFNPSTPSTTKDFDVDTTAPAITVTQSPSPPPAAYRSSAPNAFPGYSFNASAELHPGTFRCIVTANDALAGGTTTEIDCPTTTNYKPSLAEGTYALRVKMTDAAGNTTTFPGTSSAPLIYRIDDTRPTVAITGPTLTNVKRPAFNVKAINAAPAGVTPSDIDATKYTCMFTDSAGAMVGCSIVFADMFTAAGATVVPTGDLADPGTHGSPNQTLAITITDLATNTATVTPTKTFTVDLTNPTLVQMSFSTSPTSTNPTLTFTKADERAIASVLCTVDALAPATDCSSGTYTYAGTLADGSHVYHATITDAAGNSFPFTTTAFVLDATAPIIAVSQAVPASPMSSNVPMLTGTLSNPGTSPTAVAVSCSIDGSTTTGDASCLASPTSVTAASATLTFNPAAALSEGSHTLRVFASDAAGNTATDSRTFFVDTAVPVITISTTTGTKTAQPTLAFAIDDGTMAVGSQVNASTVRCQVDSDTAVACATPYTFPALADGSHTYRVTASDNAGNVAVPKAVTFLLDTKAPLIVRQSGPADNAVLLSGASISYGIRTDDLTSGTFSCVLTKDGTPIAVACDSTYSAPSSTQTIAITGATDGIYVLTLSASDGLPHSGADANPGTLVLHFIVDSVAPNITIDTGPATNSIQASGAVTFGFTVADTGPGTQTCTLVGGSPSMTRTGCSPDDSFTPGNGSSTFTATGLTDGSYTFTVTAVDHANNAATPKSRTFTVDTHAPTVVFTTGPADNAVLGAGANSPVFGFTVDDTSAGTLACKYVVGSTTTTGTCSPATFAAGSTAGTYATGPLSPDGTYTITVTASDGVNVGSVTRTVTVDTTPPAIVGPVSSPPASYPVDYYDFTFVPPAAFASAHTTTPAATVECAEDGGAWATCTSPHRMYASSYNAAHVFHLRSKDPAGNRSADTATTWTPVQGLASSYAFTSGLATNGSLVGAGLNLTCAGTAPAVVCGQVGDAIPASTFTVGGGNGTLDELQSSQAFTAGLWVRVHAPTGTQQILSTLGATGGFSLSITHATGEGARVLLSVKDDAGVVVPLGSGDLVDGEWTHVAFVSTGSPVQTELFIDGTSAAVAPVFAFGGGQVSLTGTASTTVDIDELAFRNLALSTAAVCTQLVVGTPGSNGACQKPADPCLAATSSTRPAPKPPLAPAATAPAAAAVW